MEPRLVELRTRVDTLTDELTILKSKLSESFDSFAKKQIGESDPTFENQIATLKDQTKMYDRLFQEKEAEFQVSGGKTRQQTLQEYNLLFFYIAYGVLTLSLSIYQAVHHTAITGAKTFGLLALALMPITALMVKYL